MEKSMIHPKLLNRSYYETFIVEYFLVINNKKFYKTKSQQRNWEFYKSKYQLYRFLYR